MINKILTSKWFLRRRLAGVIVYSYCSGLLIRKRYASAYFYIQSWKESQTNPDEGIWWYIDGLEESIPETYKSKDMH